MEQQIISIEVEDKPGTLMKIASLFSRRGFNIESLTVGNTHKPGISRFTIVFIGDDQTLEQLRKQTQKLIHVITTLKIEKNTAVIQEYLIVKIKKTPGNSEKIERIVERFELRILYESADRYILEISGSGETIHQIKEKIGLDDIIEFIGTGKIALPI